MVLGLLLAKAGVLQHNFNGKLEYYISSSLYVGNIIDWQNYLPSFLTSYIRNSFGNEAYQLLCEYLSSVILTMMSSFILYAFLSTLIYCVVFLIKRKQFLPKLKDEKFQILFDIKWSMYVIICQGFMLSILNMLIPRYSLVYYNIEEYSTSWYYFTFILQLAFNETWIYWTHYFGHYTEFGYQKLHWVHHKSVQFTPFSGWTFHPADAFLQGCNTFISCYFFPIHISVIQIFGLWGGIWSILLHDNLPVIPIKFFMYSTHHSIHHLPGHGRKSNLGHMTTVWDRIVGTYEDPEFADYGWHQYDIVIRICNVFNRIYDFICPDRSSIWKNKNICDHNKSE